MSWTYLKFDNTGELLPDSPRLPGPRTAYLGFEVLRHQIVIGYTEDGGYHSFLDPNVDDDCNIVAFAPLTETEPIDLSIVAANCRIYRPMPHYSGLDPYFRILGHESAQEAVEKITEPFDAAKNAEWKETGGWE